VNLPFFIARRYLTRQRGGFSAFIIRLAIVATALSVAVMVMSVCVTSGFKTAIRDKLYSFWGHVLVVPYNNNPANIIAPEPVHYDANAVAFMKRHPHIRAVSPFAVRFTIIQYKGQMEGVRMKGVAADFPFSPAIDFTGSPIDYSDTAYSRQIILSRATAARLDLKAGDTVQLYFLEAGSTLPRIRKVRVSGLYHTGMEDIDQYLALCDLRLLQHINNWSKDQINGYQVEADDERYAGLIADDIYNSTELSTQTLEDSFPAIIDWLNIQNTSVRILIVIMSLVATINLSAALLILIVERATITGLLKALGLNNASTQKIFLYIAALTGGAGVLLGNIIALGICLLQQRTGFLKMSEATYFMDKVPVRINWGYIGIIDLATLAVTVLCMWLPTIYVRRIQPARVLQFK